MRWHLNHAVHGSVPWAVQAEASRRCEASGRKKYGFHMEQGLGKTAVTLNDFVASDAELCVVVAPNSFKADWALAPAEWGIPGISTSVWPWRCTPIFAPKQKHLLAINYEAARRDYDSHSMLLKLLESRRCMLVLDETSCIKNPSSETTKSCIELAKRATYVRSLNGTPITQNVMDLYGQLRCLGEFNGTKSVMFRARYAQMGGYMGRQIVGIRDDREDELHRLVESCSFRALKEDWRKDLPPQVFTTVHLEMTARQRRAYGEMLEEFYTTVRGLDVTASMVLTQMNRLQQISSCLAMDGDRVKRIERLENDPKLRAVLDLHAGGEGKTIVVYVYKASGDALYEALEREKLQPARLRGSMHPEELLREKRRFNDDPACRVLVAQEAAACMGHNLIGGEGRDACYRMVFHEQSFSLRDRLQMQDRIHRGSQKETCQYFDPVISPIEETVIEALRRKKSLADSVDDVIKAVRREHG